MSAATTLTPEPIHGCPETPESLTLLELVRTVGEVTENEDEIVATVLHMLRSGRVRLCGNFRDRPIAELVC